MNALDSAQTAEPTLFAATLTPHRSLSPRGFFALMSFVCAVSFAAGIAFWMMGAWPVFGFFGLDVLAIYWAFKLNFRHARASEDILVTPSELRIRRTSHRGRALEWRFNPLWVRLDSTRHEEFGLERIFVVSRGRRVSLGSFLGPDEKESFFKALLDALLAAKRGAPLADTTR